MLLLKKYASFPCNKKDKKEGGNGFMDKKSFQLYWEKNIYLIRQNPYIYIKQL